MTCARGDAASCLLHRPSRRREAPPRPSQSVIAHRRRCRCRLRVRFALVSVAASARARRVPLQALHIGFGGGDAARISEMTCRSHTRALAIVPFHALHKGCAPMYVARAAWGFARATRSPSLKPAGGRRGGARKERQGSSKRRLIGADERGRRADTLRAADPSWRLPMRTRATDGLRGQMRGVDVRDERAKGPSARVEETGHRAERRGREQRARRSRSRGICRRWRARTAGRTSRAGDSRARGARGGQWPGRRSAVCRRRSVRGRLDHAYPCELCHLARESGLEEERHDASSLPPRCQGNWAPLWRAA